MQIIYTANYLAHYYMSGKLVWNELNCTAQPVFSFHPYIEYKVCDTRLRKL